MFAMMLPLNQKIWGKIVDFIVDSEFAKDRIPAYIAEEHERDEWRSLSIDGTTKLANAQKTQATAVTKKSIKFDQALDEDEQKYSIITVLGVSGKGANLMPVHTEGAPGIVEVLLATFTPEQLLQVKHICTQSNT